MGWLRDEKVDISKYLPEFVRGDPALRQALAIESKEHERQRLEIRDLLAQAFIDTATWGLTDWERILALKPAPSDSYEQRRNRILLKLQGWQVSTLDFMARLCARYTVDKAAEIEEHNEENRFRVYLHGGASDLPGLREALETYKPAHLAYNICYTLYGDLFDDEDVTDAGDLDFWAASFFSLSDDVPYGIPIKADKHDGALIRGGTICRKAERIRDGTLARCGIDATAAPRWGKHIDYIFRSDGKAARDGALQHDGRLMRRGEKPWKIEYPAQMEEFSVLLITLAKDGAATFEDTLDDYLPRNSIAKRDGNGRHGLTAHPVDSGGGLTITRARQRNGRIRRDGGDINLHDGSIRRGGLFCRNGGGIKRRIDVIHDTVSGGRGIKKPRKEAPLRLRYPELDDVCGGVRGEETASMAASLGGFADILRQRLTYGGSTRRDGRCTRGMTATAYESGGVEVIKCRTRSGSINRAGGFHLAHDGSLIRSGKTTHDKGGNTHGISRQYKAL